MASMPPVYGGACTEDSEYSCNTLTKVSGGQSIGATRGPSFSECTAAHSFKAPTRRQTLTTGDSPTTGFMRCSEAGLVALAVDNPNPGKYRLIQLKRVVKDSPWSSGADVYTLYARIICSCVQPDGNLSKGLSVPRCQGVKIHP